MRDHELARECSLAFRGRLCGVENVRAGVSARSRSHAGREGADPCRLRLLARAVGGFNGIRTLVLTDLNLRVYMAGVAITARRAPRRTRQRVIPLTAVRSVSQYRRRAVLGRGEIVVMKLVLTRGRRVFVSKYEPAAELAALLRDHLADG